MNKKLLIGFITFTLFIFSCGQSKETTYKRYTSLDKSYSIEVPAYTEQGECVADFMSFADNSPNLTISIERINGSNINDYVNKKGTTANGFKYSLFQESDTTSFYKITRGNNMWIAYELYMLKKFADRNYLIKVCSDHFTQSKIIEMAKHIHSSMTLATPQEDVPATETKSPQHTLYDVYSHTYYSIKYPKDWEVMERVNGMTDAYIFSKEEDFGFTIVRFETDYSLSEIITEGNSNLKQAGFNVTEDKLITLCGVKCYRSIYETKIQDQKVRHISYTFKKDHMLYNIKLGNVITKKQETIAKEIIDSFHFK